MSPDALVRMVLFVEALALAVGVGLLGAHAFWWWWYERWSTGRLDAVRRSLREALAEGERQPVFTRDFIRLPMRLQIYLLAELAPHLSGAEQQALRRLAMRAGLLPKAERLCRSWFWSRRLFGAKICTLVGHPAPAVRALLADRNRSVRAQAVEWALHAARPRRRAAAPAASSAIATGGAASPRRTRWCGWGTPPSSRWSPTWASPTTTACSERSKSR